MADSSEPAFLFLYRKGAVAPVDYLSTFATAPFISFAKMISEKTKRVWGYENESNEKIDCQRQGGAAGQRVGGVLAD